MGSAGTPDGNVYNYCGDPLVCSWSRKVVEYLSSNCYFGAGDQNIAGDVSDDYLVGNYYLDAS